jgi:uncharacterized protein (DUF433 family)
MMGKPTIAGTRITVEFVLERLAAEKSQEQILGANPQLPAQYLSCSGVAGNPSMIVSPDDIRAALAFAAQVLHADVIYPVAANAA